MNPVHPTCESPEGAFSIFVEGFCWVLEIVVSILSVVSTVPLV